MRRSRVPYLAHVRAPHEAGTIAVSRTHPPIPGVDSNDHATMHPGIWLGFGDISKNDFWRNRGPRVEHVTFTVPPTSAFGRAGFTVRNRYLAEEKVLCEQTCAYQFVAREEGVLILVDTSFSSGVEIDFGTQEEMGLGIRAATPITVKAGGRMLDSEGRENERGVWGKQADWCDYSAVADGVRRGMTIFTHPENPHRCWFHARDYGALVANPFGPRAGAPQRLALPAGAVHRLRFGILVYANPAAQTLNYARIHSELAESFDE